MLDGSCECGAVRIEVDEIPDDVTDCNCSICRRYSALWGYFNPKQVRILPPAGATTIHTRGKLWIEFHHCTVCGCVTHWSQSPADRLEPRMGVNMRMFAPEIVAPIKVVLCDGASW